MRARSIRVPVPGSDTALEAELQVPDGALGVVIFAHGSGSGRHSPRNQFVARALQGRRIATLLVGLLTEDEERIDVRTAHLRFDIDLLARRVVVLIDWVRVQPDLRLPLGLFGASTGAAAALVAATIRPDGVAAIVSRGGRPDLAGLALPQVTAPTLLLVGSHDEQVLELNREAGSRIHAVTRLELVSGATHLFEEPGTLEHVADRAGDWFTKYFSASGVDRPHASGGGHDAVS
jgi:pimeloyl-ACP methyl ester carboxylesterase